MHSFVSFKEYLLASYHVPGAVLGTEDAAVTQKKRTCCCPGEDVLIECLVAASH